MASTWPGYLELLESGELARRAQAAVEALADCTVCPRQCHADRRHDDSPRSYCRTGRLAVVSSAFPHHGEEDCLRGWGGSGTIFFSNCNLRCVFCQNFDISWQGQGRPVTAEQLADQMLRLQELGCHNINFVTPSHVVPQILEALAVAAERGLRLPLVYNTGGYDRLETLRWLDGVVDIYMPDFKFWNPETAQELAEARRLPGRGPGGDQGDAPAGGRPGSRRAGPGPPGAAGAAPGHARRAGRDPRDPAVPGPRGFAGHVRQRHAAVPARRAGEPASGDRPAVAGERVWRSVGCGQGSGPAATGPGVRDAGDYDAAATSGQPNVMAQRGAWPSRA